MRDEVVVELRNIVRRCKFDFKLATQQLITFCELHGYDTKGIDEKSVREEYTKDFIASTTSNNEKIIETATSPSQDLSAEENLIPTVDKCAQRDEFSSPTEMMTDEAKSVHDDKPFLTEIDHAVPSTAFSIIDLIEREGFDEFLAEIEAELDLRADSKSAGGNMHHLSFYE